MASTKYSTSFIKKAVTLGLGVVAGGVGSVLAGGSFMAGVRQGFFSTAFNHLMDHLGGKLYNLVVLFDGQGAMLAGHTAVGIEQKDGTYEYVSLDGAVGGGAYGPPKQTYEKHKSLASILEKHDKYEAYSIYKIAGSKIKAVTYAAKAVAEEYYDLFANSCIDVPTKALAAAFPNSPSNDSFYTPWVPRGRYNDFQFNYWKHLDSTHPAWFWQTKYTP